MTDAKIIHEDAVRERYQARDRAGRKLADDIQFAKQLLGKFEIPPVEQ